MARRSLLLSSRIACTFTVALVLGVAGKCIGANSAQSSDDPAAQELFARKILPMLKDRCFACHGENAADIKGKLTVTSRVGLLRGGESRQAAIVPGKPDESPLYLAVLRTSDEWSPMPPKENDKLAADQIAAIKTWIAAGAPWPGEDRLRELRYRALSRWESANGIRVKTSGGLNDEWTNRDYDLANLWAYQPLQMGDRALNNRRRSRIDEFIERRLAEIGLKPAPAADRRTLIRRATFDLIGLPPSPEEVAAFVNDPAPDDQAFAQVVDRLLASPHYGEQWGRHWLDVARYADSSGFANDYERGNAWRYRDYVIRAFNNDKPYDKFVREQLAGDEIAERLAATHTGETATPGNAADATQTPPAELLVAVGFLRAGPWELTGMEVAKVARQRFLDDVTETVGQVFLAHPLQCARCHDHKFDPIPTRDYYAIQAVFATTQIAERPAEFLDTENRAGFEEKKYVEQRIEHYRKILRDLDQKSIKAARAWYAQRKLDPSLFEELVREMINRPGPRGRDLGYEEVRATMLRRGIPEARIPPRHAGFTTRDYGMDRIARKGIERLCWLAERYEPVAHSVYSGRTPQFVGVYAPLRVPMDRMTRGELEVTHVLSGGDPFAPAQPVEPGVLSVIENLGVDKGDHNDPSDEKQQNDVDQRRRDKRKPTIDGSAISGRRTAFANWVISPKNPLTARVMVNRIWQWHFGQALAGTPNNFGATGRKPTHAELLDWLAKTFIDDGWSVKTMHRVIMTSDAYRRASRHPDPKRLAEHDPAGISYARFRPRRLDAEELRDAILCVSGELNRTIGGVPIRPEIDHEVALQPRQVMGTFAEAWQPSALPEQRNRRSIYALRLRGLPDPFMEVFNAPGVDVSCEARDTSTVVPQVMTLFNSSASFNRALAFAARLRRETPTRHATIDRAFQLAFSRSPTPDEAQTCLAHWRKMADRHRSLRFKPPSYPREIQREAVDEDTGERFTFVEPLEVYADFVPDLGPADADADLRGLAEVCLILFNANEFLYVY